MLEDLSWRMGVDRVRFLGQLPRHELLKFQGEAHVLVHPILHDSGRWVYPEAMAAGRSVPYLDLGGPGI